jgi:hypothetical protein
MSPPNGVRHGATQVGPAQRDGLARHYVCGVRSLPPRTKKAPGSCQEPSARRGRFRGGHPEAGSIAGLSEPNGRVVGNRAVSGSCTAAPHPLPDTSAAPGTAGRGQRRAPLSTPRIARLTNRSAARPGAVTGDRASPPNDGDERLAARSCRTTLRGQPGQAEMPPQAARVEGPPRTRPGRCINRAERIRSARPFHSP